MKMKKALIAFTVAAGLGFTAAGNVPLMPFRQHKQHHLTKRMSQCQQIHI